MHEHKGAADFRMKRGQLPSYISADFGVRTTYSECMRKMQTRTAADIARPMPSEARVVGSSIEPSVGNCSQSVDPYSLATTRNWRIRLETWNCHNSAHQQHYFGVSGTRAVGLISFRLFLDLSHSHLPPSFVPILSSNGSLQ